MKTHGIRALYPINIAEGEGLGTAYEYYVKFRKLKSFLYCTGIPKKILVAGLPEKYGLSMDFILLGQTLHTGVTVVDDRYETIERARETIHALEAEGFLNGAKINFREVARVSELEVEDLGSGQFDLALSSEVFQRLGGSEKEKYISSLRNRAKSFALFVPNGENRSHASLSGLKGEYLRRLIDYCERERSGMVIHDYGYIDMPPFPPGLTRSQEKRDKAAKSRIESILMKGLECYSLFEDAVPIDLRQKKSHIIYIMARCR